MKHLLLSIAMLAATYASAQLFVRPNPSSSTDSYVYVKDVQLYVDDYINLQKNANPTATDTTEASIYLRGSAQLFQGDSGVNEGNGMLSVYQTIDSTSAFHYTYWNSPVGVADATPGNRSTGILRFYDCDECGERSTSASQVQTTPGHNGNSSTNPATVSTRWTYIKERSPDTEVEANWSRIYAGNGATPFLGLIFKGVSPGGGVPPFPYSYTFDMRGRPNNGNISYDMMGETRVLTGNPYPSTIDLKEFFHDPDNNEIEEILFWSEPKDSEYTHYYSGKTGGYGYWVSGGSDPLINPQGLFTAATYTNYTATSAGGDTGEMGQVENRRFSPIGQGFELKTDGTGDGIIIFKNSHRVYEIQDGTDVIFRNPTNNTDITPSKNPYEGYSPQIRMTVNINNYVLRSLLLGFDPSTTDRFDRGWDAGSIPDATFGGDAWMPILRDTPTNRSTENGVIQFVPYDNGKRVPLTFNLTKNTNELKIHLEDKINIEDKRVWLLDNVSFDAYELTDGGEVQLFLEKGRYEGRFEIIFKDIEGNNKTPYTYESLVGEGLVTTQQVVENSITFNQDNRAQVLNVTNPEGYDIKNLNVFDMSGKLVLSRNNVGNSTKFTFPTDNLADGVYLVLLTTQDDIQLDYKISVSNR